MEYANNHHFAFRIDLAVDKFVDKIKEIYQDKFLYLHNEDNDDYVYEKKWKKNWKKKNGSEQPIIFNCNFFRLE